MDSPMQSCPKQLNKYVISQEKTTIVEIEKSKMRKLKNGETQ